MIGKRAGLGLIALCLLAVGLRGWHLDWGLPEVYEEAEAVHLARGLWGDPPQGPTLRPDHYRIPSLTPYVFFAEQAGRYFGLSLAGRVESLNDFRQMLSQEWGRTVLHGRWVSALLSGLLILPVFALARRYAGTGAAWAAAILAAVVPPAVETGRTASPDALFVLLTAFCLVQATAMIQEGRRSAYLWGGVLAAGATAASYPGVLLLFVYLVSHGFRSRSLKRSPLEAVAHLPLWEGLLAFTVTLAVTMPYVLLDLPGVWGDLSTVKGQLGLSRLGEEGVSLVGRLGGLATRSWTLPLALGALGGALASLTGPSRRAVLPAAVLALALIGVLWAWGAQSVDSLVMLVPVAVAWTGVLARRVGGLASGRAGAGALTAVATLALAAWPAAASWDRVQAGGREDSRDASGAWLEEHAELADVIITEAYGPHLSSRFNVQVIPFNAVTPHVYDAAYTPELYAEAEYVVLSSKIFRRYRRAPAEYPQQNFFYEHISRGFDLAQVFGPPGTVGPEIRVLKRKDSGGLQNVSAVSRHRFDALKGNSAMADYLSQLGTVMARGGWEDTAFTLLQEAVVMDPAGAGAWMNLGNVQLKNDRVDDALFSLRKARELDPENAAVHYNLGILHQRNAEWSQAERAFTEAVTLDPSLEAGFLSLARVLIQGERYGRARVVLREFLHRFPRSPRRAQAETALATLADMGPGKP